jgi:hypothetical protein
MRLVDIINNLDTPVLGADLWAKQLVANLLAGGPGSGPRAAGPGDIVMSSNPLLNNAPPNQDSGQ